MRCSGKLESKKSKANCCLRSPSARDRVLLQSNLQISQRPRVHGARASPDVVRESQLVMYCKVLQSYTGYIVWLWYMWFPFSEFGMVLHGRCEE